MKKQDNKNNIVKNSDHGQVFFYQTENGKTKIEVRLENETVWLNQLQMAELFDKGRSTIAEHIQNVFEEGELEVGTTCRKFRQVLDVRSV
jgi:hypothetical protein